jgi:hypothetical protein
MNYIFLIIADNGLHLVVALDAEKTYEIGAPSKATTYNKYHKLTNSKALLSNTIS